MAGWSVNVQGCESECTDFVLAGGESEQDATLLAHNLQRALSEQGWSFGVEDEGEDGRIWVSRDGATVADVLEFFGPVT